MSSWSSFRILLAAALLSFAWGHPPRLRGDEIVGRRQAGVGNETLLLLHSTPVNSPESKAALDVWEELRPSVTDFADAVSLDCDEFPDVCLDLDVAHFPQAILFSGGELIPYHGPITRKAVQSFVIYAVPSPVAELDEQTLDWWLRSQVAGRRALILLNEKASHPPPSLKALARKLAGTHAVAEVRLVTFEMLERFGASQVPSLVMSRVVGMPAGRGRGSFLLHMGDMKRSAMLTFALGKQGQNLSSGGKWWEQEGIKPVETFSIQHLREDTAGSLCKEICAIIFTPDGVGERLARERRVRIAVARDIYTQLDKTKRRGTSALPRLLWASTAQKRLYAAVQRGRGEGTEGDVVLAVWKVIRNRIAVLASTLTVESGVAFVQGVMAGDARFRALQQDASMLLQYEGPEATGSEDANEGDVKSIIHDLVPPRVIDWKRPSNLMRESKDVPEKLVESTGSAETAEVAEMDNDGMEDEGVMF